MAQDNAREDHGRRTILGREECAALYARFRDEIKRAMDPQDPWAIVGVKEKGSVLARRLREDLSLGRAALDFGEVDISLYRDDWHLKSRKPKVLGTEIPFSVEGRRILLVDDVLYTGRTVRSALDLILDFGRPRKILLGVLIDRGHRELPIAADFTGRSIATSFGDRVEVCFRETDGEDRVELLSAGYADSSAGLAEGDVGRSGSET